MDVRLYWIWLAEGLKAGYPHMAFLMRQFKHPRALYEADKAELTAQGVPEKTVAALSRKSLDKARNILDTTLRAGYWIVTPDDALYPSALLNLPDFPGVLYGVGEWHGWENVPSIAVVGTRHISAGGIQRTAQLTAGLVAGGMAIVSGGAVGGDAAAIETALDCGGVCVVVQACGLDVPYPAENAELRERLLQSGGVLLSEYPPGTKPGRGTFQIRNRLMSGLALGTLVTEAQEKSGTLITAHRARDQGRDVFAVPGDAVLCGGCHQLIREGAQLVTGSGEVLTEYFPLYGDRLDVQAAVTAEADFRRRTENRTETPEPPPVPKRKSKRSSASEKPPKPTPVSVRPSAPEGLTEPAKRVFEALSATPKGTDELAAETDLSPAAVLAALTELEIFGCAENSAGRQYTWKG